jgi:hypothetical protein
MATMERGSWTDERLDDLNQRVENLDRRMEDGFREVRGEIAALHRTVIQLFFGTVAMMIVGFGGTIATILSQN